MRPTPAEYQDGLNAIADFRSVPVDSLEYRAELKALKTKREAEKALVPVIHQDPSKDYRWCDPRSERFPYLVMKGWKPVDRLGGLVCDNELILCWKDKTEDRGEAENVGFLQLTKGEDE